MVMVFSAQVCWSVSFCTMGLHQKSTLWKCENF